jgi:methionine sulfoxide reductase heme-binding subunit
MSSVIKKWILPLQILTNLAAWIPLSVLVFDFFAGRLSINPIQDLSRRTGDLALIFLLVSLACTPISSLFLFRPALKVRRTLGLYAFFFAAFHFLLFIWADYRFDLALIWLDVNSKAYIFAGAGALIILTALAFTSYDFWKKHLGKTWKRLHRLVYLAAMLVVLHFAWVKKGDLFIFRGEIIGPLIALTALVILLLVRLPTIRKFIAASLSRLR